MILTQMMKISIDVFLVTNLSGFSGWFLVLPQWHWCFIMAEWKPMPVLRGAWLTATPPSRAPAPGSSDSTRGEIPDGPTPTYGVK